MDKEFANAKPGSWGEFVKGVDEDIVTDKKLLALTFDACGQDLMEVNMMRN